MARYRLLVDGLGEAIFIKLYSGRMSVWRRLRAPVDCKIRYHELVYGG